MIAEMPRKYEMSAIRNQAEYGWPTDSNGEEDSDPQGATESSSMIPDIRLYTASGYFLWVGQHRYLQDGEMILASLLIVPEGLRLDHDGHCLAQTESSLPK